MVACILIDSIMITIGVGGFGKIVNCVPYFMEITTIGGIAFLTWYGARAFYSAWTGNNTIQIDDEDAGLTANQQAYIDKVNEYAPGEKVQKSLDGDYAEHKGD